MAIIEFPTNICVEDMSWGQLRNDLSSRSPFGSQTLQLTEPWWTARLAFSQVNEAQSDELYRLTMALEGQRNQLALWNLGRPIPLGTMRGSPVLSAGLAAGIRVMLITGATPNSTLRVGDMLGIGAGLTQQVVMVQAAVTLDSAGAGTVQFLPPLRNAFTIGTPVVYDKPKALFRRADNNLTWNYTTINVAGFNMDFVEDPRT